MNKVKKYKHMPTGKIFEYSDLNKSYRKEGNNTDVRNIPCYIVESGKDWEEILNETKRIRIKYDHTSGYHFWNSAGIPVMVTQEEEKSIESLLNGEMKQGWTDRDLVDFATLCINTPSGTKYVDILEDFKQSKNQIGEEKEK